MTRKHGEEKKNTNKKQFLNSLNSLKTVKIPGRMFEYQTQISEALMPRVSSRCCFYSCLPIRLSVRWPLNGGGGGCCGGHGWGPALGAGEGGQGEGAICLPGRLAARRAPGAARQPVLGVRLVLALRLGVVGQREVASLPGLHSLFVKASLGGGATGVLVGQEPHRVSGNRCEGGRVQLRADGAAWGVSVGEVRMGVAVTHIWGWWLGGGGVPQQRGCPTV